MKNLDATRYLSPPEVAERYGVAPSKVLGWIRRGELRAVNVVATLGGRPRFRISPADLVAFETRREAGPQPRVTRRRRKRDIGISQFFKRLITNQQQFKRVLVILPTRGGRSSIQSGTNVLELLLCSYD